MSKLALLLVVLVLSGCGPAWAKVTSIEPSGPDPRVVALAVGAGNEVKAFTPKITFKDQWNRHVPMVYATSPWSKGGSVPIEVPEFVHGRAPGDRRGGFLFAGRSLEVARKIGGVRYPSLQRPKWKKIDGGGIALDTPLEGGLTVHFRVIPHDRMVEIRFGLTNKSGKAIRNAWVQICPKGTGERVLSERHPKSSWMLSGGELISWDGAGQSLAWLEKERDPKKPEQFVRSCFFMADVGTGGRRGSLRMGKHPLLNLGRRIDLPAIAKADQDKRRSLVVYGPSADKAFYNVLQPCFHANPRLGTVPAGTSRWTQNYLIYFQGDLADFMKRLSAVHAKIAKAKTVK